MRFISIPKNLLLKSYLQKKCLTEVRHLIILNCIYDFCFSTTTRINFLLTNSSIPNADNSRP